MNQVYDSKLQNILISKTEHWLKSATYQTTPKHNMKGWKEKQKHTEGKGSSHNQNKTKHKGRDGKEHRQQPAMDNHTAHCTWHIQFCQHHPQHIRETCSATQIPITICIMPWNNPEQNLIKQMLTNSGLRRFCFALNGLGDWCVYTCLYFSYQPVIIDLCLDNPRTE